MATTKPHTYRRPRAPLKPGSAEAGVYAIHGPAGVYIGQSSHIPRRIDPYERLGLRCEVVLFMPGSSRSERTLVETEVADNYARLGWIIVTMNTSAHVHAHQVRVGQRGGQARARNRQVRSACSCSR